MWERAWVGEVEAVGEQFNVRERLRRLSNNVVSGQAGNTAPCISAGR